VIIFDDIAGIGDPARDALEYLLDCEILQMYPQYAEVLADSIAVPGPNLYSKPHLLELHKKVGL